MAEFLLEILSEEIPARMQTRAAEDLKRLVTDKLKEARLEFSDARAFATPRRLALVIDGLPEKQPDVVEERKGPRTDAPEKAIQGFLKSAGLDSVDQCEVRETEKGTFYFVNRETQGKQTCKILADATLDLLLNFPWPKSMRWALGDVRWVRPFQNLTMNLDGENLNAALALYSANRIPKSEADRTAYQLQSVAKTIGHRFLAPEPFEVSDFADYEAKLRDAFVILDGAERQRIIAEQAAALAKQAGLTVKDDPALLEETAGLVEWPVVLMGGIDAAYMDLPDEVLTTAMRSHQKYFACLGEDGRLADRFLVVSNMEAPEDSTRRANIVAGNERVLRARLADARFFWDQDRLRTLRGRAPALRDIVFHARLGSLDDKIDRVQALAVEVASHVPGADKDRVASAARLAKADLTTEMVGEFPELQGIMGRYYALNDGEHPDVADAIAEHYSPLGPNDACPSKPVSVAVALADKIDTLVGFWAIDEKPTGSKDPYALRRAALGVIRLIAENDLRVPLLTVVARSRELYGIEAAPVGEALLGFIADRMKVALKDRGVRHDLIAAVFALGGEDDLVRLLARVDALEAFLATDDGANLLTAYRRAVNIVQIEEKKDKAGHDGPVDAGLLAEPAEKALNESLTRVVEDVGAAVAAEDFKAAMAALAKLRTPVDLFFDQVTVNTEEANLRANRLRLLSQIRATLGTVADFSKIEG